MKGIYTIAIAFLACWTTTTAYNIPTKCPAVDPIDKTIHLPHESDCTKFYKCLGGAKIVQQCPFMNKEGDRLHFNRRLQVCDSPKNAGCQPNNSVQDQLEEANVQSVLQEENDEISTMQNVCPPNPHPWNTTIHIPHETDCTKFYMCLGTYKVVRDCPFMNKEHTRRLHFNAREQVCDWPGRAGCRGTPFMQDQPEEVNVQSVLQEENDKTLTMNNILTDCPAEIPENTTIHIPHESNCSKFYMCLGKIKILQVCPAGLHFNPRLQVCDWPERAGCKTKTFVQDQPEEANVQSVLQEKNDEISTMQNVCPPNPHPWNTTIHIPHETDCTKFYMCLGTYKIVRDCPFMNKERTRRLHFNAKEQVCDWPGRAGCQKNPSPGSGCNGERYLPHEHNCDMFYECKEDNKILRECVDGMYFSIKLQGCVKYEDSECTKKKPPVKCSRKDELLSHECDCTKYYKCRDDDQILLYCENGLHFSAKHQKCMKPSEAGCDPNEVVKPGDCPKLQPEHPWRHECDCRLFYKCVDGKKRIHECSWGSYFNTKTGKCDSPKNVQGCENNLGDSF